ncbi:MAG: SPOR domain-containing protein [Pseudomonadota bacterium]
MDKALKQRLVGATVLVALAVLILPILLGGQPDSAGDARPIEIPDRPTELAFETRRFPIGEQPTDQPSTLPDRDAPALDVADAPGDGALAAAPEPEPATLQERLERIAEENASERDTPPVDEAVAVTSGEAVSVGPDAAAAAEESGTTVSGSETAAGTDAADSGRASMAGEAAPTLSADADADTDADGVPVADAERAGSTDAEVTPDPPAGDVAASTEVASTVPSVAVAAATVAANGRYLVQVASFSSTANANRLAASLREGGMPVLMDTVDSAAGVLHRVRVGPFAQEAEADQVVARLARQVPDVRPRIVDLRPEDAAPSAATDDPLIRWSVQVGVFSEAGNAEQLVFSLRDAGYRAQSQREQSSERTIYRVLVGPEISREEAIRIRDRIEASQGIKGIVQSTE